MGSKILLVISSFTIFISSAVARTYVYDDFRNAGSLYRNWDTVHGRFFANQGYLQSQGGELAIGIHRNTYAQDSIVSADVSLLQNGQNYAGLILRWSGQVDANMYYVMLGMAGNQPRAILYVNVAGTWTALANVPVPSLQGRLEFSARGSLLKVVFDGVQLISIYDRTFTAGLAGVRGIFPQGSVDNFVVAE